jgi:hypothetical protein
MVQIVSVVIVLALFVAAMAMIRMWINGLKAGDALWFITPSVVSAGYNSRYLRIFATCVLVAVVAVILLNLLFLMGYSTHL